MAMQTRKTAVRAGSILRSALTLIGDERLPRGGHWAYQADMAVVYAVVALRSSELDLPEAADKAAQIGSDYLTEALLAAARELGGERVG